MIAAEQARAFGLMLLCGAGAACSHDALRLIGWTLGGRAAFASLMDLFLGAWLALGMTATGLYLGVNPMRLYMFVGVALGAAIWYAACGMPARRLAGRWRGRSASGEK